MKGNPPGRRNKKYMRKNKNKSPSAHKCARGVTYPHPHKCASKTPNQKSTIASISKKYGRNNVAQARLGNSELFFPRTTHLDWELDRAGTMLNVPPNCMII